MEINKNCITISLDQAKASLNYLIQILYQKKYADGAMRFRDNFNSVFQGVEKLKLSGKTELLTVKFASGR